MKWSDLMDSLTSRGYRPMCIEFHEGSAHVSFAESEHARMLAAELMKFGIPRTYRNNCVNAIVSFPDHFAPRILELL